MRFKTDKTQFDYYGYFYRVPVYVKLHGDEGLEMQGRNVLCDLMLTAVTYLHMWFIEPAKAVIAHVLNIEEYNEGFPVMIGPEIEQ